MSNSKSRLWIALRCREIMRNSPTALRLLKSAMNAVEDGQSGLQQLGGDATMLFYNSEEGNEVQFLPDMSLPGSFYCLHNYNNHQNGHCDADWWQVACTLTTVLPRHISLLRLAARWQPNGTCGNDF